ncbi:hypothetical protein [Zoogloea sp.]|uniref:hypothetical protein n=1 Tax=Zoogloea sp. TaxID=49181 RepID=UPI001416E3CC|nr:MAG: hypothetical protein F9K15_23465 [Zoogloea sp.]
MQTQRVIEAAELARQLLATSNFVAQHYGTYRDGRGKEHYVNGPACRQLREVAQRLRWALTAMEYSPAAALPAMPD